jgi:class 3 adenylate cyclase/tetratricopeptide (TPR) repeat protein
VVSARRERKVVTVLFADLVGFTARAELLDPEDVEAILRPYHARLRGELERFGGTVEKFIGDAVMALFGAPLAHEDDPERAVRAALAIRDWAREEEGVQVRIAVNTGEALVNFAARPEAGETVATGDVVNTTARLQAAAPVNGVLAGETTYRATRAMIEYREAPDVEAKGKTEPVRVWEAVRARSRVTSEAVAVRAALVGRERELAVLSELLVRVREEASPQLVTLVGVPGIGKSRLVYELMQLVEQGGVLTYWRRGRSLPYGEGVPLWALAEIVKAQAGILESDPPDEVARKLLAAVENAIGEPGDAAWVEAHLRALVGIAGTEVAAADRRSEGFAAWRRFFEGMADQRPLVLVFEDLHWADDQLLEFVDYLVDWASRVPILIVCTARPELLERRPGWGGGKLNATTLSLSPLSETDTSLLLSGLLDRPLLPAETQQALLARAGGNPLYAEQYAQLLLERSTAGDLPVPETVQGIIAARLDRLPAGEKGLLQDAVVLGKVFWLGGVVDGRSRSDAEQILHALERKGFVQRARSSSVADETEHTFLHLLVRDVAYGQIPRAERAEKHRHAAEWIESLGRPQDHAEMLVHHYSTALELARASGQPTEQLAERARFVLREAGDRAIALNAFDSAARSYTSALELWPVDDPERPRLLLSYGRALFLCRETGAAELVEAVGALVALGDWERAAEAEILLADGDWRAGRRDDCYQHVDRAVALLRDAPSSAAKARVLSEVARYHMLASRNEAAIQAANEALTMATELGLHEVRAHALNNRGASRVQLGDAAGMEDLEQSIKIANAIGSIESLRGYNNLSATSTVLGDLARAAEAIRAGVEAVERFGAPPLGRWVMYKRAPAAYWAGSWDEALQIVEETLAELGPSHALSRWAFELRGRVRLARGDTPGALEDARISVELGRKAKDPQTLLPALSFAAVAFLAAGENQEAELLAHELLQSNVVDNTSALEAGSAVFDLACILASLGRSAELLEPIERATVPSPWTEAAAAVTRGDWPRAASLYAEIGHLPIEAYTRLRAAEQLVTESRRVEADEQLQKALSFFRSVRAARYVNEGETLLAATG